MKWGAGIVVITAWETPIYSFILFWGGWDEETKKSVIILNSYITSFISPWSSRKLTSIRTRRTRKIYFHSFIRLLVFLFIRIWLCLRDDCNTMSDTREPVVCGSLLIIIGIIHSIRFLPPQLFLKQMNICRPNSWRFRSNFSFWSRYPLLAPTLKLLNDFYFCLFVLDFID